MSQFIVKFLALFLYSIALLVSRSDGMINNGRETRLNGRFKPSTGNWCSWTEELSSETSTIISVACQCMGKTGQLQAYTCQYISQGELLHDCKASRPKPKDIYNEIGAILAGKTIILLKILGNYTITALLIIHIISHTWFVWGLRSIWIPPANICWTHIYILYCKHIK